MKTLLTTALMVVVSLVASCDNPKRTDATAPNYKGKTDNATATSSSVGSQGFRPPADTSFVESDWHVAFNSRVTKGQTEVVLPTGRVDILTDEYAIEVDKVRNYRDAIKQALQYAAATKKKPGLALYMDGQEDTMQALDGARRICRESDVRFWFVNEYVSVNDLVRQKTVAGLPPAASTDQRSDGPRTTASKEQEIEKNYWLSPSGVRHNRSCRWFGNTKSGRYCGPNEGRACKQCGG